MLTKFASRDPTLVGWRRAGAALQWLMSDEQNNRENSDFNWKPVAIMFALGVVTVIAFVALLP